MSHDPLRVLMVTPGYPPAVGGTEIQCARLSEALAARGARVRVVTRGREDAPRDELRAGVEVRRSRFWGHRETHLSRVLNAASFVTHVAAAVREVARSREPGWVVHHHGLGMTLVASRVARGGRPLPIVAKVLCGGAGGECARLASDPRFALVRWVLRDVERFVALQPAIQDELARLGVDRGRVEVLPNGVPIDGLAAMDPGEQAHVLFGGRLDPQKDLATLVEAWALVARDFPAARLTIAGEGPERAALAERVERRGLASSVSLPGFSTDYADRLGRARVFVLPSRFEGMSNALLEAMVAARACVASDIPENRHTLGDAGLYFPVGDFRRLASQLNELLGSPAVASALGSQARQRATAEFGLPSVIERYEQLYRRALGAAGR